MIKSSTWTGAASMTRVPATDVLTSIYVEAAASAASTRVASSATAHFSFSSVQTTLVTGAGAPTSRLVTVSALIGIDPPLSSPPIERCSVYDTATSAATRTAATTTSAAARRATRAASGSAAIHRGRPKRSCVFNTPQTHTKNIVPFRWNSSM